MAILGQTKPQGQQSPLLAALLRPQPLAPIPIPSAGMTPQPAMGRGNQGGGGPQWWDEVARAIERRGERAAARKDIRERDERQFSQSKELAQEERAFRTAETQGQRAWEDERTETATRTRQAETQAARDWEVAQWENERKVANASARVNEARTAASGYAEARKADAYRLYEAKQSAYMSQVAKSVDDPSVTPEILEKSRQELSAILWDATRVLTPEERTSIYGQIAPTTGVTPEMALLAGTPLPASGQDQLPDIPTYEEFKERIEKGELSPTEMRAYLQMEAMDATLAQQASAVRDAKTRARAESDMKNTMTRVLQEAEEYNDSVAGAAAIILGVSPRGIKGLLADPTTLPSSSRAVQMPMDFGRKVEFYLWENPEVAQKLTSHDPTDQAEAKAKILPFIRQTLAREIMEPLDAPEAAAQLAEDGSLGHATQAFIKLMEDPMEPVTRNKVMDGAIGVVGPVVAARITQMTPEVIDRLEGHKTDEWSRFEVGTIPSKAAMKSAMALGATELAKLEVLSSHGDVMQLVGKRFVRKYGDLFAEPGPLEVTALGVYEDSQAFLKKLSEDADTGDRSPGWYGNPSNLSAILKRATELLRAVPGVPPALAPATPDPNLDPYAVPEPPATNTTLLAPPAPPPDPYFRRVPPGG